MLPLQRFKGTTSAETLGLFAVIGALAVLALAIVQVASSGVDATVARAAWWVRLGLAEAGFTLVLVVAWLRRRRRAR